MTRTSGLPLHAKVRRHLLRQIQSGEFPAGSMLPGEMQLEALFGVSRITVRRALRDLAASGFISREPGRGTFVLRPKVVHHSGQLDALSIDLVQQGVEVEVHVLRHERAAPPPEVARAMTCNEHEDLLLDRRLLSADKAPFGLGTSYFKTEPGLLVAPEHLQRGFLLAVLKEVYGLPIRRVDRTMSATTCSREEARTLRVSPSTPMLVSELLIRDGDNRPIGAMRILYRGDRYLHAQSLEV